MLSSGDNPTTGQATATTTPAALASHPCSSVCVQNDPGSAVNLSVGDATHQYMQLKAGQALSIPCSNTNQVYIATGSSTATVNYLWVS